MQRSQDEIKTQQASLQEQLKRSERTISELSDRLNILLIRAQAIGGEREGLNPNFFDLVGKGEFMDWKSKDDALAGRQNDLLQQAQGVRRQIEEERFHLAKLLGALELCAWLLGEDQTSL